MEYKIGQPVLWCYTSLRDPKPQYVFGVILDYTSSNWPRYRIAFTDGDDQWFSHHDTESFVSYLNDYLKRDENDS